MTIVELRCKINELGAARAEHPYGTPEFNKANEELRSFTREQILNGGECARHAFLDFCDEVVDMRNFYDEYPDNEELKAEMEYFQETVEWLRKNNLNDYADELQECINGEI